MSILGKGRGKNKGHRTKPVRGKDGRATVRISSSSAAILTGEADVTTWDDEELIRGQRRDKNGGWSGKPPRIIPKAIHQELVRRTLSDTGEILRRSTVVAAQALEKIIKHPKTSDADRLKAISLVFDRILGRAPEKVTLDVRAVEAPWQKAARIAIVGTAKQVEGEIVEAEIVGALEQGKPNTDDSGLA